jgi:hypothetical protein
MPLHALGEGFRLDAHAGAPLRGRPNMPWMIDARWMSPYVRWMMSNCQ